LESHGIEAIATPRIEKIRRIEAERQSIEGHEAQKQEAQSMRVTL
jgi:hypothetical protein